MQNMNPIIVKTDEHKLQNTLSQITFDKLNEIKADKVGRTEINNIEEKFKEEIDHGLFVYLKRGQNYYLPFSIGIQELDALIKDPKVDEQEVVDELSILFTAISLYTLSKFYETSLLSSDRNDHHAYMFKAVNSFAHTFYSDHMIEGLEFYIIRPGNRIDEMNCLLYWFEFATVETVEEWTI